MSKLPTKEEFFSKGLADNVNEKIGEELFICPKCGSGVRFDPSIIFATDPPKRRYYCLNCRYRYIG